MVIRFVELPERVRHTRRLSGAGIAECDRNRRVAQTEILHVCANTER